MTAPIITPGKLTRAMMHSRNVSCESASVDTNLSNPLLEATAFCGRLYARGVETGDITIRGYWASDDPTLESQLHKVFEGIITPAYFVVAPWCAAGKPCYGGEIKSSSVKVTAPAENIVTVDGEMSLVTPDPDVSQGHGSVHRGMVMYYAGDAGVTLAGGSGTTNGDAVNVGSSIGGRLLVHYYLSWVPPLTDTVTIKVQHSANGTTGWTDFTGASVVVKAETMGPGDNVVTVEWSEITEDAYWRVVLTRAGSNAKLFYNLFAWVQWNNGAGALGDFVIVEDSDSESWVTDVDSSDYVIE